MTRTGGRTVGIAALLLALVAPGCSSAHGGPGVSPPGWSLGPRTGKTKASKGTREGKEKPAKKSQAETKGNGKGKGKTS